MVSCVLPVSAIDALRIWWLSWTDKQLVTPVFQMNALHLDCLILLVVDFTMGLTSFLPQDTPTSILTILVLCILYSSTLAAYRLLLDPLSKFPGPRLAAFTRYYEFYYDVLKGGQYGNKIRELHKIYGEAHLRS